VGARPVREVLAHALVALRMRYDVVAESEAQRRARVRGVGLGPRLVVDLEAVLESGVVKLRQADRELLDGAAAAAAFAAAAAAAAEQQRSSSRAAQRRRWLWQWGSAAWRRQAAARRRARGKRAAAAGSSRAAQRRLWQWGSAAWRRKAAARRRARGKAPRARVRRRAGGHAGGWVGKGRAGGRAGRRAEKRSSARQAEDKSTGHHSSLSSSHDRRSSTGAGWLRALSRTLLLLASRGDEVRTQFSDGTARERRQVRSARSSRALASRDARGAETAVRCGRGRHLLTLQGCLRPSLPAELGFDEQDLSAGAAYSVVARFRVRLGRRRAARHSRPWSAQAGRLRAEPAR
jgi:hypothetical protein